MPKFVVAMFGSSRDPWVVDTAVGSDEAHGAFADVMTGAAASRVGQLSNTMGGGGLKWRVDRQGDTSTATCVGGRPARIPLRGGNTQRIPPDGQEIDFEQTGISTALYEYQLIPSDMTVVPYMLVFSLAMFPRQFRHFYRSVVKQLRALDPDIEVDYPVSAFKVFLWVALLVLIIVIMASA